MTKSQNNIIKGSAYGKEKIYQNTYQKAIK